MHEGDDGPPAVLAAAEPDDGADIQRLYAHHVLTGAATFELEPPDVADMVRRVATVREAGLPWLVARDPQGGRLLGYAYAAVYRARPAYRLTVEDSIYLSPEATGRGLGTRLLAAVIERCAAADRRQMIAVITTPGSDASVALHRRLGFETVGHLPDVGYKFGRWHGTLFMQRALGPGASAPPAET